MFSMICFVFHTSFHSSETKEETTFDTTFGTTQTEPNGTERKERIEDESTELYSIDETMEEAGDVLVKYVNGYNTYK